MKAIQQLLVFFFSEKTIVVGMNLKYLIEKIIMNITTDAFMEKYNIYLHFWVEKKSSYLWGFVKVYGL